MLYYFASNGDEEPLGCIDIEAFSSVEAREITDDGRVTLELARPGEGAEGSKFLLQAETEDDGSAWIDALRNESYSRLRMERDFLRTQSDEFIAEIQKIETQLAQRRELEETLTQVCALCAGTDPVQIPVSTHVRADYPVPAGWPLPRSGFRKLVPGSAAKPITPTCQQRASQSSGQFAVRRVRAGTTGARLPC